MENPPTIAAGGDTASLGDTNYNPSGNTSDTQNMRKLVSTKNIDKDTTSVPALPGKVESKVADSKLVIILCFF